MTERTWLTSDDEDQALKDLRAWFRNHPDVTDPDEGIKALGLPDMTGVPEHPKDRNSIQRRMAKEARLMELHAGYAMRHETWLREHGPLPAETETGAGKWRVHRVIAGAGTARPQRGGRRRR